MNIDNILDPINEDRVGGRKVILRLLDLTGGAKKKKKKSSKKKKRSSRKSRRKSKYDINLDDFDRYDYRYRYSNINTFSKSRAPKMGSNDAKMGSNDAKTGSRIPRIRPPPPPPAAAPMPPLFRIPPIGRTGIHDGIAGPASPISPIGKPVPVGAKMTFGEGFTEEIESYMNQ